MHSKILKGLSFKSLIILFEICKRFSKFSNSNSKLKYSKNLKLKPKLKPLSIFGCICLLKIDNKVAVANEKKETFHYRGSQQTATEPHGISLHLMGHNLDINRLRLESKVAQLLGDPQPLVNAPLDLHLEPLVKVLEHGAPARQHNILVQVSAHVDGTVLNALVHNDGQGLGVVRIGELGMKEDLRPKKPLIPVINEESNKQQDLVEI